MVLLNVVCGLARDALILLYFFVHFFFFGGLLTIVKGIIWSTLYGDQPRHERDELNLRVMANWLSFGYQVLLFFITPLFLVWRFLKLLVSEVLMPLAAAQRPPSECCYAGASELVGAYPTERWYFINGICTDQHWLQLNCQQLEAVFERPVVGIYNETNGIVVDIIESFAQRNLNFPTQAARDAADFIRQDIRKGVNKVVLIGHSQGGIIVSIVLQLLNRNELAKLSAVFTFACAADEFPNPRPKGLVIEHYANRNDLVAELGVLHFHQRPTYQGRLFVAERGGHLLNTFYSLDPDDYQLEPDGGEQRELPSSYLFQLRPTVASKAHQ